MVNFNYYIDMQPNGLAHMLCCTHTQTRPLDHPLKWKLAFLKQIYSSRIAALLWSKEEERKRKKKLNSQKKETKFFHNLEVRQ